MNIVDTCSNAQTANLNNEYSGRSKPIAQRQYHNLATQQKWLSELYTIAHSAIKSESRTYATECKANANKGLATFLCPISGQFYTMQADCIGNQHTNLPIVSIHPTITANLPSRIEEGLPLNTLLARLIYALCNQGLITVECILPLSTTRLTQGMLKKLQITLPMLNTIIGNKENSLNRLPRLALTSLTCVNTHATVSAISIWATRCYGMLYTPSANAGGYDIDTAFESVAELDAILNADSRSMQLATKREDAAIRAARNRAIKRINTMQLADCVRTVRHTMSQCFSAWSDSVHGNFIQQLVTNPATLEITLLQSAQAILREAHPDLSICGLVAYTAYEYTMQAIDCAMLRHSVVLLELGMLSEDTNDALMDTLNRYASLDSTRTMASLSAKTATSGLNAIVDSRKLNNSLVDAVVQAVESVNAVNNTASNQQAMQATIAQPADKPMTTQERIAAIRAARSMANTKQ